MPDPLIHLLAELPSAEPSPARVERSRLRCRARLARQAPATAHVDTGRARPTQLWPPAIAVLGGAYLMGVIIEAVRLYGLFID